MTKFYKKITLILGFLILTSILVYIFIIPFVINNILAPISAYDAISVFKNLEDDEILSEKLLQNSKGEVYISLVCDEFQKETFDLSVDDIKLADSLLIQAFVKLNSDLKRENQSFICDLEDEILIDKYIIQYCGHLNENKEKVISIQCIRKDNKDDDVWKTKWIRAIGGGCRYVHGEINLNRKSHSNFFINAPK